MFDEKKFPMAVSIFFVLVYSVCALLIWFTPDFFLSMMKPIMHGTNWDVIWNPSVSAVSFIWGLIETIAISYVLAWVFAKIYQTQK